MTGSAVAQIIPVRGVARRVTPKTANRRIDLDAKIRRLLQDLREVLSRAMNDSTEIQESVQQIREEGWGLYLVVDRKRDDETPEAFELTAQRRAPEHEAVFKIDSRDLSFLRSVGIDPTRRVRRRRRGD